MLSLLTVQLGVPEGDCGERSLQGPSLRSPQCHSLHRTKLAAAHIASMAELEAYGMRPQRCSACSCSASYRILLVLLDHVAWQLQVLPMKRVALGFVSEVFRSDSISIVTGSWPFPLRFSSPSAFRTTFVETTLPCQKGSRPDTATAPCGRWD